MSEIVYSPIGIIRTPFNDVRKMPIQPPGAKDVIGTAEVFEKYREGLKDLDGFSHIILIYHFHRVSTTKLQVVPFLDNTPKGVFATRAPVRPNPIGLSVVPLISIKDGIITFSGADILNNTPLLDVKPFVPAFDIPSSEIKVGWLERGSNEVESKKADDRFISQD